MGKLLAWVAGILLVICILRAPVQTGNALGAVVYQTGVFLGAVADWLLPEITATPPTQNPTPSSGPTATTEPRTEPPGTAEPSTTTTTLPTAQATVYRTVTPSAQATVYRTVSPTRTLSEEGY